MRVLACLLVGAVVGLSVAPVAVRADEPRVEAEQAKVLLEKMIKEARQLKEAGKHDEAKALMEKAEAMARSLKQSEAGRREGPGITREMLERGQQELQKRREHVAELRRNGKADEAEKAEQEIKALAEKLERAAQELERRTAAGREGADRPGGDAPRERREGGDRPAGRERPDARERAAGRDRPDERERADRPRGEAVEPRVKHLLEAAEHLAAAGRGDLAEQLTREAHALREGREVERPRGDRPRDGGPREGSPVEHEVREMREQVRRIHAEMEELRNLVRRLAERREER